MSVNNSSFSRHRQACQDNFKKCRRPLQKKKLPLICKECKKQFDKPSKLRRHELIHEREKFFCGRCKSGFKRSDHRANHELTCTVSNDGEASSELGELTSLVQRFMDVPIEPEAAVDVDLEVPCSIPRPSDLEVDDRTPSQSIQCDPNQCSDHVSFESILLSLDRYYDDLDEVEHDLNSEDETGDAQTGDAQAGDAQAGGAQAGGETGGETEDAQTGDDQAGGAQAGDETGGETGDETEDETDILSDADPLVVPEFTTPKRTVRRNTAAFKQNLDRSLEEVTPKRTRVLLNATDNSSTVQLLAASNSVDTLQFARIGIAAISQMTVNSNTGGYAGLAQEIVRVFGIEAIYDTALA